MLSTRHYHTTGATIDAVNALVTFHLNYWKSLLLSLPSSQTARLRVHCRQTPAQSTVISDSSPTSTLSSNSCSVYRHLRQLAYEYTVVKLLLSLPSSQTARLRVHCRQTPAQSTVISDSSPTSTLSSDSPRAPEVMIPSHLS